MSKDPAFLFYASDFLTGISDLTMEERGQFITLLCLQHQKGHLTEKLMKLTCHGIPAADVMAKFRQDAAGLWYNERLDIEIEKRAEHSEKQRQRALDGWEKRRKNKTPKDQATANATALPLEDVNENEDVIDKVKEGVETIRSEKSNQVFIALQEHFGISEQTQFNLLRELDRFVTLLQTTSQTDLFIEQFKAYNQYKEKAQEKKHNFKGFIGTPETQYQDGGWCADNWIHKLQNFTNGKPTDRNSALRAEIAKRNGLNTGN